MKKIAVFSGAGLDAESGVETFRSGSNGMWNNYKIEDVATPEGWRKDKQKVLEESQAIADEWCVPMRLNHVLGKMTLNGIEPGMDKMGDIIKNMVEDIYIEARGEIVENREVQKAIGTKTVTLFKQYLRKKNFGDKDE